MTCAACARRIERALTNVDGVADARVNLVTQQARVAIDSSRTNRAALEAAVVAAGYGVLPPAPSVGPAGVANSNMAELVGAGAPFVRLDQALTSVPLRLDEIGLPYQWKYGPATRNIGDATYGATTHAFSEAGLRPLAPVHVRSRTGQRQRRAISPSAGSAGREAAATAGS